MTLPYPSRPNPNFQPRRIGRRLMVVPAWLDPPLEAGVLPIRLDPGGAFGDGLHPTTQLCLRALERHLRPGTPVIDLGTGTGILAIAAARLGAGPILAVDTDPEAVRVARLNVAANQMTDQIRVEPGSLAETLAGQWGSTQAPLVIANILTHVLLDFFEHDFPQAVAPGGWLILSGILITQTPDIRARLLWHDLKQLAQEQLEDWVCIIAQRPG
jgi:ribosomal protein L11 methyltransferase